MKITPYNHHAKAPSFPRSLSPQTKTTPGSIEPSLLSNQLLAPFEKWPHPTVDSLAAGCSTDRVRCDEWGAATSQHSSGTQDSVHLAAHVFVGDALALIERREALANLLLEPFVVVKAGRNELAHDLVRRFTRLR